MFNCSYGWFSLDQVESFLETNPFREDVRHPLFVYRDSNGEEKFVSMVSSKPSHNTGFSDIELVSDRLVGFVRIATDDEVSKIVAQKRKERENA